MYKCQSCDHNHEDFDHFPTAKNLSERLDQGAPYTELECPKCGALVYPVEVPKTKTVYAMATDTDGGLELTLFDKETDLDSAIKDFIESYWPEDFGQFPDDPQKAWDIICEKTSCIDSYTYESKTITL